MRLAELMLTSEVGASVKKRLLIQGMGDDFLVEMLRQPALAAADKTG